MLLKFLDRGSGIFLLQSFHRKILIFFFLLKLCAATVSLTNLFHGITALIVKNFLLIPKSTLHHLKAIPPCFKKTKFTVGF